MLNKTRFQHFGRGRDELPFLYYANFAQSLRCENFSIAAFKGAEGGRKKQIKCDIYQIGTQHGGQTCKLQGATVGGGRGMVPKRAACCMRGKLAMKFRFILLKRAP